MEANGKQETQTATNTVVDIPARPSAPPPAPETLIGRIASVMGAIARVKRTGVNAFHNYRYASEADVLDELRPEMAARGLVLIPTIVKFERRDMPGTKAGPVTTVWMKYTLHASGLSDKLEIDWVGEGQDPADKGLNKALTAAEKFVLSKIFLVSSGDSDPEDDSGEKQTQRGERKPEQPRQALTPVQEVEQIVKRYGFKSLKEAAELIKKATGKASSKELNADDVADVEWECAVRAIDSATTGKELGYRGKIIKQGESILAEDWLAELSEKYKAKMEELKDKK